MGSAQVGPRVPTLYLAAAASPHRLSPEDARPGAGGPRWGGTCLLRGTIGMQSSWWDDSQTPWAPQSEV